MALIKSVDMIHFNESYPTITTASISANTPTQFQMRGKHWSYVLIGNCATAGNIKFNAGDSALAGGDLVIPIASGQFAISVEDALVKTLAPVEINGETLLDVITFSSDVALTNVMVIRLPY